MIDPASRTESMLNVVIENGKIAALTRRAPGPEDRVLDAAGKVVCPGFVDIHMHEPLVEDLRDLSGTIFAFELRMGVTTAVCGNCGDSVLPPPEYGPLLTEGIPLNLCFLAPHGAARNAAGFTDKYASLTTPQIEQVAELLRSWVDWGCWGLSYGIRYFPGMNMEELLTTARVLEGTDLFAAAHVRDDADYIFSAIEEFLEPGRQFGVRLQVSHLGSMGGYGQMAEVLSILDEARAAGVDVMSDCYPYSAFSTTIGSCTYDPGFLERYGCGYEAVELCEGKYKGQICTKEIFDDLRQNYPDVITVAAVMDPADVELALCHPAVMLCTDGDVHAGQGHPRAAGSFPRLIAEYVRTGKMTMSQAIEKMTLLPARRLGLRNKGSIAPGCDADLVIFNPETIRDRSTFQAPGLPPEGIDYVLLGGEIACAGTQIRQERLGRLLRRH